MDKKRLDKIIKEEVVRVNVFESTNRKVWNKLLENRNKKVQGYTFIISQILSGGIKQAISNLKYNKLIEYGDYTIELAREFAPELYKRVKIDFNKIKKLAMEYRDISTIDRELNEFGYNDFSYREEEVDKSIYKYHKLLSKLIADQKRV